MDNLTAQQVDAAWLRFIGVMGSSMQGHTMTDGLRAAFDTLTKTRAEAGLASLESLAASVGFLQ